MLLLSKAAIWCVTSHVVAPPHSDASLLQNLAQQNFTVEINMLCLALHFAVQV